MLARVMRRFPVAMGVAAAMLCADSVAAGEKAIPSLSLASRSKPGGERTVVAYSLHGTLRCTTCRLVEQGAEEVIRAGFAESLADGSLVWCSVNIRLPENQHFAADYQVSSWGLVLAEYRGNAPGKWRRLSLAGNLVHADPGEFRRYVTAEVRAFLDNTEETGGEIR